MENKDPVKGDKKKKQKTQPLPGKRGPLEKGGKLEIASTRVPKRAQTSKQDVKGTPLVNPSSEPEQWAKVVGRREKVRKKKTALNKNKPQSAVT